MNDTGPIPQSAMDWIHENAATNDFAHSLLDQWKRKGELSVRQIGAVMKILRRTKVPREQLFIDDANLYGILYKAVENGVRRPALRLSVYKFKLASDEGHNKGAIWVTSSRRDAGGEAFFFGKIKDGVFYPSENCIKEDYESIKQTAENPFEEATLFGKRTGMCCVCGRKLTNEESINKMIGPICAERFGL